MKAISILALSVVLALSQITGAATAAVEAGAAKQENIVCLEHVFTREEIITEPGLVRPGKAVRTCERCGYTEKVILPEFMQAGQFSYSDGSRTISLPYRIYYPTDSQNSGQTYPLVLYYHGAGEVGTDNTVHVNRNALIERLVALNQAIVLAPQCREGYKWVNTPWSDGSYDSTSIKPSLYLDASIALLYEIIRSGAVDESRVYAAGISMGGYATWNVMMEHPEVFAAVIPICGAADPERAAEVLDVAVWAFHGENDRTVPVSGSREMIEAIRDLGGTKVRYTEYEGKGHNCWQDAFAEPELTDWLFSQRKT